MMIRRSNFLAGASAAGGLTLLGANPPIGKPEKPNLRVGLPVEATSFLPVYVAQAKTWAANGLDVQLLAFRGDAEVAQALAGDSVDINVASTNGLINMINAGQPVIGFYAGFWQADFSWLSIPSVKRWEDLKGKTVGVSTFGSLTDALTRYALRKHKLEPEKDVQIIQGGGTPQAYQALKSGRIASALISPPFKWQGPEEGLNVLSTEAKEVAPQWPKHVILAKTKFIKENPNTIIAFLRAHVAAIRLAKAQREVAIQVMIDRLKYQKQWAERAYDDVINDYNERGLFPDKYMPVFWQITMSTGDVKEPWPDSKLLDLTYIKSFKQWAPT
jgi:NitT/TauT family transport system substrate-binding protein